jgi:non-reducing end alpha-L-arabinofuranosidase
MKRFIYALVSMLFAVLVIMMSGQQNVAALTGPGDIYNSAGMTVVAAHSTVRALFGSYAGSLYQVRRASDSTTLDIGVISAGGFANAAAQDSFCSGTTCVITKIYDQSGHGNFLEYQGSGSSVGGQDTAANATNESLTASGNKVYSLYINPGNSYWRNGSSTGIPTGSAPEGIYMVTSGTHVNSGCCFDYGNSETTRTAAGAGHMDAIYFGTSCWFGGCSGSGPWVQADLEYGLFPGGSSSWNPSQVSFTSKYVTAMLKNNGTTVFAIKGGNAQIGSLTTLWNGALPSGYNPMRKEGAIILGSGGDCCATNTNQSAGTFYEGAIVSGYPSDATDDAVQANIIAAGYGTAATTVPTAAPTTAPTNPPACSLKGDVNGTGSIDIVDALLVAQYYVGLAPSGFNPACADVNCSGSIDVVDALLIAQRYVGLISVFPC